MDKTEFFALLDIDTAEEFTYYENMASLMEEERHIEENLLADLLSEVELETFAELLDGYFEEFARVIPDEYDELGFTVDTIRTAMVGALTADMERSELQSYAELIARFRRWYSEERRVLDREDGSELSVMEARYGFIEAGLTGSRADYDFSSACQFDLEGYDMRLSDIIERGETADEA